MTDQCTCKEECCWACKCNKCGKCKNKTCHCHRPNHGPWTVPYPGLPRMDPPTFPLNPVYCGGHTCSNR